MPQTNGTRGPGASYPDENLARMMFWNAMDVSGDSRSGGVICDDPQTHDCITADLVLAGYDVWRRTVRLTEQDHIEVFDLLWKWDADPDTWVCMSPETHQCKDTTIVLAAVLEA